MDIYAGITDKSVSAYVLVDGEQCAPWNAKEKFEVI